MDEEVNLYKKMWYDMKSALQSILDYGALCGIPQEEKTCSAHDELRCKYGAYELALKDMNEIERRILSKNR